MLAQPSPGGKRTSTKSFSVAIESSEHLLRFTTGQSGSLNRDRCVKQRLRKPGLYMKARLRLGSTLHLLLAFPFTGGQQRPGAGYHGENETASREMQRGSVLCGRPTCVEAGSLARINSLVCLNERYGTLGFLVYQIFLKPHFLLPYAKQTRGVSQGGFWQSSHSSCRQLVCPMSASI